MVDFVNHTAVIESFNEARTVETDNREKSREANRFLDERDGQWETDVLNTTNNKPRYTFDQVDPIVDQIAGEMEQADFDIRIKPAGGEATKDDALLLDGLVRNIENISGAKDIFSTAARSMVTGGLAGWRVQHKYVDADSFDQNIMITPIADFVNRVWFDPSSKLQDKSDAKFCYVINPISKDEYDERWPDGSGQSVSSNQSNQDYGYKPDDIFIGQVYYEKFEKRMLALLSDGRVVEMDEEFDKIKDDLEAQGVTIQDTRNRPKKKIMSRLFDASNWLIDEEETVFTYIPVIPVYGNYKIENNKTRYRGVVEKLMDPQRVLNYSLSREIEEGALAPRAKWWMTLKQALGFETSIATMNTNTDPVQFYNPDAEAPGAPTQNGGSMINPGLASITMNMKQLIQSGGGLFDANMGASPNAQSGIAIERLQNKGDTGTIKYFKAHEIAICHTGRVIIDAIPKVYNTRRQERILKEDGSFTMEILNNEVMDTNTGEMVLVNDLSKGKYDVTCSAGPSFQNRQQEAVQGIIEVAKVDPSVMEIGSDILMKNMTFPGSEQLSERVRARLFQAGAIPIDQMTEEEQQELIAAQQKAAKEAPEMSPEQMIGQAEMTKAENEKTKTQISVQEKQGKMMIDANRERREDAKFQHQRLLDQTKAAEVTNQTQFGQFMDMQKQQAAQTSQIFDILNKQANTLKTLREAYGIDSIVGPEAVETFIEQVDLVSDAQDQVESA
jgi:hypothetical protein